MAFLRFTRDRRGYEQFSLVEATTNRRGKSRARLLYWYRTPPNVRVGREPFDEAVRRALEAQNPGVQFDWRKIIETPIPSAETERWRERRRAEKAEKATRRADAVAATAGNIDERDERDEELSAPPDLELDAEAAASPEASEEDNSEPIAEATEDTDRAVPGVAGTANPSARRRRRRRGRRGRAALAASTAPSSAELPAQPAGQGDVDAPASEPQGD